MKHKTYVIISALLAALFLICTAAAQEDAGFNTILYFDAPGIDPAGLAFDGKYLWNADTTDQMIYKLDTAGNRMTSFYSPGAAPTGLAYDGNYLWNADADDKMIYKLDTSGNIITSFYSPGAAPTGLAFDGTYLWNADADDKMIYKLDISGNLIASFYTPGNRPAGLAYNGEYLWNADADDKMIHKLDKDGNLTDSFPAPGTFPTGLAFEGKYLWIADSDDLTIRKSELIGDTDTSGGTAAIVVSPVSFSDPVSIVSEFDPPGTSPTGLAYDGTYLWHVNLGSKTIYKSDTSGKIIASFEAPGKTPFDIASQGEYLWISDTNKTVYKTDTNGKQIASFASPCAFAGITCSSEHLWISDFENRKIYKADFAGNILASYDSPGSDPAGITYDGEYLWITDSESRRIYKIDTSGKVVNSFHSPAEKPFGIASDGTYLWQADDGRDKIYKLKVNISPVEIGKSKQQTFSITNMGDGDLVIGKISITGKDTGDFSIQNDNCSETKIKPKEYAIFNVVFSPASAGGKNAVLQIPSNDTDEALLNVPLSGTGEGTGYLLTKELWIRAVIYTEEKGKVEALWQKGGEDITASNDRVIWGYFYADPADVSWGSEQNPDLFVKIWFDHNGRLDVNFFHVSVPDIEVYSDYRYDGVADQQGTTTLTTRYIRQYYENGKSNMEKNEEDGYPPAGYTAKGNPKGYSTVNDLRIAAIINTVEKGAKEALWHKGGQDKTDRGDEVLWGYFYANPSDVTWGSQNNPDLFVKVWFDVDGRVDVNFFHVSVPDIEAYSDLPDNGTYDKSGTAILENRYIRLEY